MPTDARPRQFFLQWGRRAQLFSPAAPRNASHGELLPKTNAIPRGRIATSGGPGVQAAPAQAYAQSDATPAFKQVDSIEARVQGCVTCHGQNGQGTNNGTFPRIAGKPAGYLFNQLAAFRDGGRRYSPMNYLVAYLPDSYLHEIAEYFSKQRPAVRHPRSALC